MSEKNGCLKQFSKREQTLSCKLQVQLMLTGALAAEIIESDNEMFSSLSN
jgi:hypothetical protein